MWVEIKSLFFHFGILASKSQFWNNFVLKCHLINFFLFSKIRKGIHKLKLENAAKELCFQTVYLSFIHHFIPYSRPVYNIVIMNNISFKARSFLEWKNDYYFSNNSGAIQKGVPFWLVSFLKVNEWIDFWYMNNFLIAIFSLLNSPRSTSP